MKNHLDQIIRIMLILKCVNALRLRSKAKDDLENQAKKMKQWSDKKFLSVW